MKINYKIITLILGILLLILLIIKIDSLSSLTPSANINGHNFSLYLAKTSNEQEVGLAKFNKIGNDKGMLFIFNKPDYYSFWMKNMKFPIDIIFINQTKIVDIFQNVPAPKNNNNLPTYTTGEKADKVLEINSGLSNKYKIKIGDTVKLNL
jgi:uncharacterized membrane protein (UPF0127 family)